MTLVGMGSQCLALGSGLMNVNLLWLYCCTLSPGLVGLYLSDQQEVAYSVLRMGLALGFILGFSSPLYLDTSVLLYLMLALIIISSISYSVLIFSTQNKKELLPCCFKSVGDSIEKE